MEEKSKLNELSTKAVLLQNYIEVTNKNSYRKRLEPSEKSLTKIRKPITSIGQIMLKEIVDNCDRKKLMIKRIKLLK